MFTPTTKSTPKPVIDKEIVGWPKGYYSSANGGYVPEDALADMTNYDMTPDGFPFIRPSLVPYGSDFVGTCIGIGTFQKTLPSGVQEYHEISLQTVPKNEVQTLSITGAPTGGTFTLTYSGQTTGSIASTASASAVQTALIALSNLATGDVVCTGGSLPGTTVTITFGNTLANTDVSIITSTSSLSGGTAPAISITETQKGGSSLARLYTRKDGESWSEVTGTYTYDNSAWMNFEQSNGRVYPTNGVNKMSYMAIDTGDIVTYALIDKPVTTVVAETGLTGTNVTYFYGTTYTSQSGETDLSPTGSVQVSTTRDSWASDGSEYIDVTLTPNAEAENINVYVGTTDTNLTLLAVMDPASTTFRDTGTSIANITITPPLTNSTDGPVLTYLVDIIGQLYGWGDINNPSFVWYDGGDGGQQFSGNFTVGGGGGNVAIDDGGPNIPAAVFGFRTGKGDPIPTVISNGPGGRGGIRQISFTPETIGDLTALMPSISEANGDVGSVSARATVTAANSVHFPTGESFAYEGSAPNIPNILSANTSSDFILTDVRKLTKSAMGGSCAEFFEGRIYFALPVISNTNNQIWILDLRTNPARWIMPWLISADHMWQYQDNSGTTHFCLLVGGQEVEFSDTVFSSDLGVPFRTRVASGPLRWDKAGIGVGYIQTQRFKALTPRGDIHFKVYGTDPDGNQIPAEDDISVPFSVPATYFDEYAFDEVEFDAAPSLQSVELPGSKVLPIDLKTKLDELRWEGTTNSKGTHYTLGATHTQGIIIPKLFAGS